MKGFAFSLSLSLSLAFFPLAANFCFVAHNRTYLPRHARISNSIDNMLWFGLSRWLAIGTLMIALLYVEMCCNVNNVLFSPLLSFTLLFVGLILSECASGDFLYFAKNLVCFIVHSSPCHVMCVAFGLSFPYQSLFRSFVRSNHFISRFKRTCFPPFIRSFFLSLFLIVSRVSYPSVGCSSVNCLELN